LDFYGGSSLSLKLLAGSPAIDAGDNAFATTYDQRGQARIFNGTVDLGAYEYDPATGLEEELPESRALVYPQPNDGNFVLVWKEAAGQQISYRLFDLQGRIIDAQRFKLDQEGEYRVKKTAIAPGVYVINLKYEGQQHSILLHIMY
jgi:hypothetical protein